MSQLNINTLFSVSMSVMSDQEVIEHFKKLEHSIRKFDLLEYIPRARITEDYEQDESFMFVDLLDEKFKIELLSEDLEEYKSCILAAAYDNQELKIVSSEFATIYDVENFDCKEDAILLAEIMKYNFDVDRIIQAVINLRNNQK